MGSQYPLLIAFTGHLPELPVSTSQRVMFKEGLVSVVFGQGAKELCVCCEIAPVPARKSASDSTLAQQGLGLCVATLSLSHTALTRNSTLPANLARQTSRTAEGAG